MEFPSLYPLNINQTQLATTSAVDADADAAWHVLGLLLGRGRPVRPSDLPLPPNLIRFLCLIPDSPICLTDGDLVTLSQIGVAALAQFFANSDLATRYFDLPQIVPRLFANVRLSGLVRTYCRKRKRAAAELECFPTIERKRFFQDLDGELNSSQMHMKIPSKFQNVTQGIQTISSLPSLSAFDCWKVGRYMSIPVPNMQILNCLSGMNSKSCSLNEDWTPQIHRMAAEVLSNSAPSLISHPLTSSNSEDGTGDQIIETQGKNGAVAKGCDSLNKGVDTEIKIVLMRDSGSYKVHKENQPIHRIHENVYHIDNTEMALLKYDNKNHFCVTPRSEDHLQSNRDMLRHPSKPSSGINPDNTHEVCDREKAIQLTKDNRKRLSGKGQEKVKRDQIPISVKHTKQIDFDQIENPKEKKDTSVENREKGSSVSNNTEQAPLPEFESFIVEEQEGSGGYGTVYRAKRKADGVVFAIKCPHVNANRHYVNNEIKMLERFGGKNFVIKYEGSFKSRTADCLVLQHVQHDRPESLKKEMNVADLQWYGFCLFKALAGLHKQGIVHRDVKPGNFLYSCTVNKGYLIDFNLALDTRKKYGTVDNSKVQQILNDHTTICRTKSQQPPKNRKLMDTNNAGKDCRSLLPPGNLKRKVDKAKVIAEASSRNIVKSQGADGSGITSAKDATSTRTLSAERLREPLPSHGRRELLSLVQEALQGGNHESVGAPKSKRKRVAAPAGDAGSTLLHITPMPLHANGLAIRGAGLLKSKGDGKHAREGPCAGTKGFKAPEVLFRSPHQGPKADIWSAGVTLLYLMIGRTPFAGDTEQNIKEIAKLRGSEDLWEVAKLHNHESVFPADLLDVKYLSPTNIREWCARNTRRPDFLRAIPRSLFDIVDKCLVVNPRQRISAEEALSHEFFAPCHEAIKKHRLHRQGLSNLAETSLHGEAEP